MVTIADKEKRAEEAAAQATWLSALMNDSARVQADDGRVVKADSNTIENYGQLLDAVAHVDSDAEAEALICAAVESSVSRLDQEDLENFNPQTELDLLDLLDGDQNISDPNHAYVAGVIRDYIQQEMENVSLVATGTENAQIVLDAQDRRKRDEEAQRREKIQILSLQIDKFAAERHLEHENE